MQGYNGLQRDSLVRMAIGIVIGLLVGLSLGLFTMNYWQDRGATAVPKFNGETQATARPDSYYICQLDQGKPKALIIKGDSSGAKKIIFPWKTDGDEFLIEQTTDLHYVAKNVEPKPSPTDSSLELNRITGDLYLTSRLKAEAVTLLASICDKRVPPGQCTPGMERLGGNVFDCLGVLVESECQKWTTGNNFRGRFQYLCKATERRF
jgi:hypothetical protein